MFRLIILAVCFLTTNGLSDPGYRLNTPIEPSAYSIIITPYFDTNDDRKFTFDGEVAITFTTKEATNVIQLHSEDLDYEAANITVTNNGNMIALNTENPLDFDKNYTFAYIHLQSELQVGIDYTLQIVYQGPIREDLHGFYANYYIEKGVKKWLGATQMEPTHARKVFPCFDEPGLKATFTLSIDRPATYKPSLANTKVQATLTLPNGYVREVFHPTPRMPTYLVAFLVSEFEAGNQSINDTRELGIYTRPEAANQTDYAFNFGLRVVEALGDFFEIDYYSTNDYLKLDHIALINYRSGAMENWGLVTYRESLLLYVPEESAPYYKYRVAQIVAHETTHMWFGNLVTCHWWSNTWLNEGFANYFQDYITSLIEPEVGSANILVTGSVYAAYDADDFPTAPAITNNEVNSPAEISGHFGTITYQKAGSVIRMMHHLLGDQAFKNGLHAYLSAHQFNSGYPEYMYNALEEGVVGTKALDAYPGSNVASVMGSWISQAGHPVLEVKVDHTSDAVTLTQRRFYINGSYSSNEIYHIPITYTTGISPDFENTKPVAIMTTKEHILTVTNISNSHSWIIFNIQETGLYRVKYDDHSYEHIATALKGSDHEKIHNLNRAKIVNDLFAFFFADEVSFEVLYKTLDFLSVETDYSVWFAAIRGLNKLRNMYVGSDAVADIEVYIMRLLEHGINKLGYEVNATDDFETLRNRGQVLELACQLGHSECNEHFVRLFRNFVDNGVSITPSLRSVAYCAGLRHGTEADYEFLWTRMSTTNVANEARAIGEILGCSTNENSLKKYLLSMLEEDSPIKAQDITVPLSAVLGNHSHVYIVIDSMKQNLSLWSSIYDSMDTVYDSVASALRTESEINEFETWLKSCEECVGEKTEAFVRLNHVRATAEWAQSHKADILRSIRNHAATVPSSMLLIFVAVITTLKCY